MKRGHLRPIWTLTGVLAILDPILSPVAGFSVSIPPLLWALGVSMLLMSASVFYDRTRCEPLIAAALSSTAAIICFTAVAEIFSYAVTAASAPLQDGAFAAWDEAIGFDFAAHLRWVAGHPALHRTLEVAYASGPAQLALIICGLALADLRKLERFINAYAICAMIVITLGGLFPTIGPYKYHPMSMETLEPYRGLTAMGAQVEHFEALRAGTFKEISLAAAEGLVNFPSFHAVLAVLFTTSLWRFPYLRLPGAALNALMMFAALSIGGHYLIDIIGGAFLAVATLYWQTARPDLRPP